MLQSIHLQGFKGFKDTEVGPFKKVNLILGGQNVGKTSLLEAVYACVGFDARFAGEAFRIFEGNDLRRYSRATFAKPLLVLEASFDDGHRQCVLDTSSAFNELSPRAEGLGRLSNGKELEGLSYFFSGEVQFSNISVLPISMHLPNQTQQVNLFGQVVLSRKKSQLLALLQKIEPRLESLDAVSPDGEQRVYVGLSGVEEALPMYQLGHGFSRLLVLFSHLLVSESKLALIDEVENGIHYTALPTLFEGIKAVAQDRGVQSLMTTHSWDAIRAACEVFAETPELFQVIRLERDGDNIKAVCIEGERMLRLMAQDMEVR